MSAMQLFEVPSYLISLNATPRFSSDCLAVDVPIASLDKALRQLRDVGGFNMLVDITAVDWGVDAQLRFSVVYHLYNIQSCSYVRVVSNCLHNEAPRAPSVVNLFPAANWHEREAYDMFGIVFEGHPQLTRILMWEGYPHYPLRKDFPLAGIDAPLPAADTAEATGVRVDPAPMMGGPFHASTGSTVAHREPVAADQSWTEQNPKIS